uniref:Uncharacterized protein n=1 Tax=Romanomermis culicivorax TaxID=13658 RepID=A0A915KF53_ROMCU
MLKKQRKLTMFVKARRTKNARFLSENWPHSKELFFLPAKQAESPESPSKEMGCGDDLLVISIFLGFW